MLLEGSNTKTLGEIVRHGPGDGVMTLNVGGKEFQTLRSTIASNAVLADHVARAEANQEITIKGSVFVDRDPTHFGFILGYLRNRVDAGWVRPCVDKTLENCQSSKDSATTAFKAMAKNNVPNLPKDTKVLQEIYMEATYYRIPELQTVLCSTKYSVLVARFLGSGGTGNPFQFVSNTIARLRAGLLAVASVGTLAFTSQNDIVKELPKALGLDLAGGKQKDNKQ